MHEGSGGYSINPWEEKKNNEGFEERCFIYSSRSTSFLSFFFFPSFLLLRQTAARTEALHRLGQTQIKKRELSVFYTNSSNQKHQARCFFSPLKGPAGVPHKTHPIHSARVLLLFVVCISEKNSYTQELLKSLHSLNSFQSS